MATATPTLDVVTNALIAALSPLLPPAIGGLPAPGVTMINLRERSAGFGRFVGNESVAEFGVVTLKGIRLEGVARFQLWAASPSDIDAALSALNSRILAARDDLRVKGFLKVALKNAKAAEHLQDVGWRRFADYRVLYEFPYHDTDEAQSILARIPIAINSAFNETTQVTDEMTRWDNTAASLLALRGPLGINGLRTLTFVPGAAPSGAVEILRTFDGATGPPVAHANMSDFLDAVSGATPAQRHASVTFASLSAFLATMTADPSLTTLGDWDTDGIPDQYQPRSLDFDQAIRLAGVVDRLEITYQAPAFDNVGVLYLRAARGAAS